MVEADRPVVGDDVRMKEEAAEGGSEEDASTVMVIVYRRMYTADSLEGIYHLLEEERPERVVLLTVVESPVMDPSMGTYLSRGDRERLTRACEHDLTVRLTLYLEGVQSICDRLGIGTETVERRGDVADVVLEEARDRDVDLVVIHPSDKGRLDRRLSGSVSDRVRKGFLGRLVMLE